MNIFFQQVFRMAESSMAVCSIQLCNMAIFEHNYFTSTRYCSDACDTWWNT